MSNASILGTGAYTLPVAGSREILDYVRAPRDSAWLEEKTGVRGHSLNFDCATGRKLSAETGLDFAERAARQAMEAAGVEADRIDQLCLTTCTPDCLHFMADTIALHRRLGLRATTVVSQTDSGCAGLAKVLQEVRAYAHQASGHWTALVVATNDVSSFVACEQYKRVPGAWLSAALFADGAGAVVLGEGKGPRLMDTYCAVDGDHPLVVYHGGGAAVPPNPGTLDEHAYVMDGRDVAAQFGPAMQRAWLRLSETWKLTVEDVRRWYVHQTNYRFIEGFTAALGISPDRVPHNVDRIGNTVSASTLLLLDEDIRQGRLPEDGPVVFLWVGAGMLEGGALFLP